MQKIHTEKAPAAVGPYSQAVVVNGLVYTSGQIALDPATGELVGKTIEEQAEQVMKNLTAIGERGEDPLLPDGHQRFRSFQCGVFPVFHRKTGPILRRHSGAAQGRDL